MCLAKNRKTAAQSSIQADDLELLVAHRLIQKLLGQITNFVRLEHVFNQWPPMVWVTRQQAGRVRGEASN